ncbi:MAG TPA: adenylosuccinate lyase [Acidobacteriota bacterium]|nr:adenylosuccinate lyase [Acidobacteriota bacterium]
MISRYSRPEMGRLWDDAAVYASWLEVELAAAESMASRGVVPAAAMEQLRCIEPPDPIRVVEIERRTHHDVIAFLEAIEEQVGPAARYLHLGMTSSDVLDTALALRCVRALDVILDGWEGLTALATQRALEFKELPCIGRSHGVHAEPMTFGLKILGWQQELVRGGSRLRRAREVIGFGQISGAVGTYNTVDPEVERDAVEALGLNVEPVSTQVVPRDRHAEMLGHLAVAAAAIERIAIEIRGLQRTEVREVEEPFGSKQKGSSVMPHKRNPIKCENLVGLARLVRAYAGTGLENVALWHERDISHSSAERVALADACILVDFMAHRMHGVLEGMHVYPDNMSRNLELTNGLVFSSRVLERLISAGVVRSQAYAIIQRNAMSCWESGEPFQALLAADEELTGHLDAAQIADCFELRHVLRYVDRIFERVLGEEAAETEPDVGSGVDEEKMVT